MVKGVCDKQSGFWMYSMKVARPMLYQSLGRWITGEELNKLVAPLWRELTEEDRQYWKDAAKSFNSSTAGRVDQQRRRTLFREKKNSLAMPLVACPPPNHPSKVKPSKVVPRSGRVDEVDQYSKVYFDLDSAEYRCKRNHDVKELKDQYTWRLMGHGKGVPPSEQQSMCEQFFIRRSMFLATVNTYYRDGERVVPSEISVIEFSIASGFIDQRNFVLGLPENHTIPAECEDMVINNEERTALRADGRGNRLSEALCTDFEDVWDEIKLFTEFDGDEQKLFVCAQQWNDVVGSFRTLYDVVGETAFSRVETRFLTIEDYLCAMMVVLAGESEDNVEMNMAFAETMRQKWSGAIQFPRITCGYHKQFLFKNECQTRACSMFAAHEAVFNFFKACERYILKNFNYSGCHFPDREQLPGVPNVAFGCGRQASGAAACSIFGGRSAVGLVETRHQATEGSDDGLKLDTDLSKLKVEKRAIENLIQFPDEGDQEPLTDSNNIQGPGQASGLRLEPRSGVTSNIGGANGSMKYGGYTMDSHEDDAECHDASDSENRIHAVVHEPFLRGAREASDSDYTAQHRGEEVEGEQGRGGAERGGGDDFSAGRGGGNDYSAGQGENYTANQGAVSDYSANQRGANEYAVNQGGANDYSANQGAGNEYSAGQGANYTANQGRANEYSANQGGNYTANQGRANEYSARQGRANEYSANQRGVSDYAMNGNGIPPRYDNASDLSVLHSHGDENAAAYGHQRHLVVNDWEESGSLTNQNPQRSESFAPQNAQRSESFAPQNAQRSESFAPQNAQRSESFAPQNSQRSNYLASTNRNDTGPTQWVNDWQRQEMIFTGNDGRPPPLQSSYHAQQYRHGSNFNSNFNLNNQGGFDYSRVGRADGYVNRGEGGSNGRYSANYRGSGTYRGENVMDRTSYDSEQTVVYGGGRGQRANNGSRTAAFENQNWNRQSVVQNIRDQRPEYRNIRDQRPDYRNIRDQRPYIPQPVRSQTAMGYYAEGSGSNSRIDTARENTAYNEERATGNADNNVVMRPQSSAGMLTRTRSALSVADSNFAGNSQPQISQSTVAGLQSGVPQIEMRQGMTPPKPIEYKSSPGWTGTVDVEGSEAWADAQNGE